MRLFIAIPVPEDIKNRIVSLQKRMRVRGVKWVKPPNMHLTLNFLGETDPVAVEGISGCMRRAAAGAEAFDASVSGTGVFPDARRPRVLWVGCGGESGAICSIKSALDGSLSEYGFLPENKPFVPHITAGRIRELKGIPAGLEEFLLYKEDLGIMRVEGLELVKSELEPRGAVYTVVEHVGF